VDKGDVSRRSREEDVGLHVEERSGARGEWVALTGTRAVPATANTDSGDDASLAT